MAGRMLTPMVCAVSWYTSAPSMKKKMSLAVQSMR